MRNPIDGKLVVKRPFGLVDAAYKNYPESKHPGVDLQAPFRTPYYAISDGKVTTIDRGLEKIGRGREVQLFFGIVQANYCHMDEIIVTNGQQVKEGQLLGYAGWTGYVLPANKSGSHLHFEIVMNGVYTDPIVYLSRKGDSMTTEQAKNLSLYLRLAAGATLEEAKSAQEYDVNHIVADNNYAPALAKQIYETNELFRYKASRYDEIAAQLIAANAKLDSQQVDEKTIVEGVFKRFWNSLFKKTS